MDDCQRAYASYGYTKKRLHHLRRKIARQRVMRMVHPGLTQKQKEQILKDHAAKLRKWIKIDHSHTNSGVFDEELEMTLEAYYWVSKRRIK